MPRFVTVAKTGDIAPGTCRQVRVEGAALAVCNVAGRFHAIDDICTHEEASLSEGELTGTVITCPMHFAQFDVTTGEVLSPPADRPVTHYDVRVTNGDVEVAL